MEGEDGKAPKKKLKQEKITEHLTVKKKRDRFNGMPEEEVVLRLLPDHLMENLDIVIVREGVDWMLLKIDYKC